ncbi:MAG: YtxH domain-containing protein [Candidatus Eremiobacteraeota bacterium]|nr:YtxH domain-containing protein [Candidatus Eremiobacteraeota bacterium]
MESGKERVDAGRIVYFNTEISMPHIYRNSAEEEGGETMEEGKGVNFILGLLVGALVGASIAILLAPQSGTQTREQIKEKAEDVRKKLEKYGKDFKEEAEEWIEKTHHFVDEKGQEIKESLTKKKCDKGEAKEDAAGAQE